MSRRATWLFALTVAVSSGSALAQAPVGRQGSPQAPVVRVERRGSEEGLIISRYRDLRTARMVIVRGGTDAALVQGWLAALNAVKPEAEPALVRQLSGLVTANLAKGVLAAAVLHNGVRFTALAPGLPGGRDATTVEAEDARSGVSVTVEGNASQADAESWLKAANEAKTEGDFVALVSANRAKGLTGVAGVSNGIRVETRWQRK
jgi:hypothetical protein